MRCLQLTVLLIQELLRIEISRNLLCSYLLLGGCLDFQPRYFIGPSSAGWSAGPRRGVAAGDDFKEYRDICFRVPPVVGAACLRYSVGVGFSRLARGCFDVYRILPQRRFRSQVLVGCQMVLQLRAPRRHVGVRGAKAGPQWWAQAGTAEGQDQGKRPLAVAFQDGWARLGTWGVFPRFGFC